MNKIATQIIEEIPFHHDVNSTGKFRSQDFSSAKKKELVDSHSTANFKMESTEINLPRQHKGYFHGFVSSKLFGASQVVSLVFLEIFNNLLYSEQPRTLVCWAESTSQVLTPKTRLISIRRKRVVHIRIRKIVALKG